MRYQDIDPMIEEIGLPYAYNSFTSDTAQAPPYVVYLSPGRSDFKADDENYQPFLDLRIELYTKTKRYDLEARVESVLKDHGFDFDVTEDFIDSDGVFMITYDLEVCINASE